jgi:hypothetical protein
LSPRIRVTAKKLESTLRTRAYRLSLLIAIKLFWQMQSLGLVFSWSLFLFQLPLSQQASDPCAVRCVSHRNATDSVAPQKLRTKDRGPKTTVFRSSLGFSCG